VLSHPSRKNKNAARVGHPRPWNNLENAIEVGCKLKTKVEVPDEPPVILAGLGESAGEGKKKAKKKSRVAAKSKAGTPRAA